MCITCYLAILSQKPKDPQELEFCGYQMKYLVWFAWATQCLFLPFANGKCRNRSGVCRLLLPIRYRHLKAEHLLDLPKLGALAVLLLLLILKKPRPKEDLALRDPKASSSPGDLQGSVTYLLFSTGDLFWLVKNRRGQVCRNFQRCHWTQVHWRRKDQMSNEDSMLEMQADARIIQEASYFEVLKNFKGLYFLKHSKGCHLRMFG